MKTPMIRLGNPVLVKDSIGVHGARDVATQLDDEIVVVENTDMNGFAVTEMATGHGTIVKEFTKMIARVVEDFGQK